MVRTRVAPSPTGFPHLGLVYQAVFDYVLAHAYEGKFILRIEDTDRTRFVEGAEEIIIKTLEWVNLQPDEGPHYGGDFGPYRQSERLAIYKKYAQDLVEKGYAYYCFCTKERLEEMRKAQEKNHQAPLYDKFCRTLSAEEVTKKLEEKISSVIRMKIPENDTIVIHDEIVGDVRVESKQVDDQVILKSDGFPTYHLAVVVDDHLMEITHVFRGTEWLPSAPKHILLYKYLGWEETMPKFIHIPVLLNNEGGGKLSKRHAHTSVDYYKEEGFLPEAIVNYLINIVWNHPEGKEIFPLMDFAKAFTLEPFTVAIKATGARFDLQKLLWMNGVYIREVVTTDELLQRLYRFDESLQKIDKKLLENLVEIAKTRIKTLKEFISMITPFLYPEKKELTEEQKKTMEALAGELSNISVWDKEHIAGIILEKFIQQKVVTFKELYTMLINTDKGLPLADTFEAIGKEKTLALFS